MKYPVLYLLTIILFFSCNSYTTKYPFSLDDFRPELRRQLEKIVINGGMCEEDNTDSLGKTIPNPLYAFLSDETSFMELKKLVKCEHPLIRAYAFRILCDKKSNDINSILFSHLDDTAIISYCNGEFGYDITTVADYFLEQSVGNTTLLRRDVIEAIVKKYPYLINTARLFLFKDDSLKQYYNELKDIVLKKYPFHYQYQKSLLASLSAYKNDDDTSLIKEHLEYNWGRDAGKKFRIVENNPVSSYFFVIEKFYSSLLSYKSQGVLDAQFLRDENFEQIFNSFINATAAYKSKQSAAIIKNILQENLYPNNSNNLDKLFEYNFHHSLLKPIEHYDCDFYADIKKEIMPKAKAYEKKYALSPIEIPVNDVVVEKSKYW